MSENGWSFREIRFGLFYPKWLRKKTVHFSVSSFDFETVHFLVSRNFSKLSQKWENNKGGTVREGPEFLIFEILDFPRKRKSNFSLWRFDKVAYSKMIFKDRCNTDHRVGIDPELGTCFFKNFLWFYQGAFLNENSLFSLWPWTPLKVRVPLITGALPLSSRNSKLRVVALYLVMWHM